MPRRSPSPRAGRWPLLPLAPGIVAIIAVATAVTIALLGVRQLQRTSDGAAAARSQVLAAAIAARLRSTAWEDRPTVMGEAARRSGAEILLVDQSGAIRVDQSLSQLTRAEVLELLVAAEGVTESRLGRMRFTAHPLSPPLEHLSVLALVRAPEPAEGTVALSRAVALLTALLLGMAVAVAYAFMRAARDDVVFVRRRIADLAEAAESDPPSEQSGRSRARRPVPIRSLDQVGRLSAALNVLITRFDAAERSYRADLKRAAELDAERSEFLAGLSHELRTPLNAILGFTHVLETEAEGPLSDDAKEALGMIRTSGEHLRTLIDDILDLSAMETGQLQLNREEIDVYALAEDVVREAKGTIKDRQVTLSLTGSRPAPAYADARRFRQVLTNLVSNGLKFTARGAVALTVHTDDDGVRIAVADSGRGIAPQVLDTIFQAYRQAGDAAERQVGTGLGLAIARRLVLLHGGTINVRSVLDEGSTFTIRVPRNPEPATPTVREPRVDTPGATEQRPAAGAAARRTPTVRDHNRSGQSTEESS